MRPMNDLEVDAARDAILKLVDSRAWMHVTEVLTDRVARDMVGALDTRGREDVAAEYRLLNKFINTLVAIANEVRGN